ncbi:type II toxin-antitoxin system Phd/YefM family antitoxin [Myxococcota bacterium]|jgi:prevent-host-death family protein|nr:type II toxin-antitoxin system Phd/YefM family antitoxin [Myxococcota bacterium]
MSVQVNVHDAKTHFSALLDRVLAGEEIIIAKAGTPVARLTQLQPAASGARTPGSRAGGMRMADDFDAPLPDDFLSGAAP